MLSRAKNRSVSLLCVHTGYRLSGVVLKAVARRYGGKEGKLAFNEFALAITKVVSLIGTSRPLDVRFFLGVIKQSVYSRKAAQSLK